MLNEDMSFYTKYIQQNIEFHHLTLRICFMRLMLRIALPLFIIASLPTQASAIDLFFAGGANFPSIDNRTDVTLNNGQTNNYVTNTKTLTKALAGFGLGYTFNNVAFSSIDLGLGVMSYYNDFGYVKGTEYPAAVPGNYSSLDYRFDAASFALLAEIKLIYSDSFFHPYVVGGAGNAWNRLSNFHQTPTSGGRVLPPTFPNQTNSDFAYEAGAGIQFMLPFTHTALMPINFALDLGYRYLDLGKGELGKALGQGERLTVSHMRTQAVLLALQITI
jgi:opacity protein-like surface antigen